MRYNFEWNKNKSKINFQKHKVRFERATEIFMDHFAITIYDKIHSKGEDRWITLGKNYSDILLVVIHTFKELDSENALVRIISARKATKREKMQYNER